MRYWAATGLLIRKSGARPAKAALIGALRDEQSAQMRIVMAEALTHLGEWQDKGEYVGRANTYLVRRHDGTFDPSVPLLPPRAG